jgi:lactate 2-monooxygenase
MARYDLQPVTGEHPPFPYDPASMDKLCRAGNEAALKQAFLGREWIREISSGTFKTWEDLKFVQDNWDGPIVVKGILSVAVSFCLLGPFSDASCRGSLDRYRTLRKPSMRV